MQDLSALLLFLVAIVAGGVNAIAGGGGLIIFPILIFMGIPPLYANGTNKTALWFGTFASTVTYHRHFSSQHKVLLFPLTFTSILGGIFGSHLLLNTPPAAFSQFVPYLMFTASILFACKFVVKKQFAHNFIGQIYRFISSSLTPLLRIFLISCLQLGISIYGGFFGGGGGIIILAILHLAGVKNIHQMNAYKSWFATCMNSIAIINLALSHKIIWNQVVIIAAGALIGGYLSAYLAQRFNPQWINYCLTIISFSLSLYLLLR